MSASTEHDLDSIADIVGPVAAREFENAKDFYKPGLIAWARKLPKLSDAEFLAQCGVAIHDSALVNSFRGNWEHEHFKASACYHEAQRRHVAAGHSKDCRGTCLYGQAHARVMRGQGHEPSPTTECTCGAEQ
jgi:hypothetical protein